MQMLSENKKRKRDLVASFVELYKKEGNFVFLIDYSGLNAEDNYSIRSQLRAIGANMYVLRNTLNSIALKEAGFDVLSEEVNNQVAAIVSSDSVGVAKIITKAADGDIIKLIAYSDGNTLYRMDSLSELSKLPSLEVLRAKLLGLLVSIPTKLTSLLLEPSRSLVRVLDARSKKD